MAAAVQSNLRTTIFDSVFPPKHHTTATPENTPNVGTLASEGVPFGGFGIPNDATDLTIQVNRWWSAATRFLTLPPGLEAQPRDFSHSPDAQNALLSLLKTRQDRKQLLDWYLHEVSTHFRHFVLPTLSFWQEPVPVSNAGSALSSTVQILQRAQALYLATGGLSIAGRRDAEEKVQDFWGQIKADFHVLVLHSLPRQRVQKTLSSYLFQCMQHSLEQSGRPIECLVEDRCRCSVSLDLTALQQLQDVGLGGRQGENAFAHAVHRLLQGPAVERRCFQVDWNSKRCVIERLRVWVREELIPPLEQAVTILAGNSSIKLPVHQSVSAAVNSFGRSRSGALFDYVTTWPASQGAVLDIREYINANGAEEKAKLCSSFSEQIQRRLFHAGASTTEILSVYISVIHVFRLLDSRGVLLEKVAIPIRSYLRSREDTVTTIASSFLLESNRSDVTSSGPDHSKVCVDIAEAVAQSAVNAQEDRTHMDFDNMEWMPDPIDAGSNYRSSKSDDVVAYIIGLFEPDDFIKAFSNALGQHLLQRNLKDDFDHEIKIIELLKSRLDASKLQHAEVMLMDMRTSAARAGRGHNSHLPRPTLTKPTPKEIQEAIPEDGITLNTLYNRFRNRMESPQFQATLKLVANKRQDLYFAKRTRAPADTTPLSDKEKKYLAEQEEHEALSRDTMSFDAKVVSSYFWPQLREADMPVSRQIRDHRTLYSESFQSQSAQRKLEWKPALDTMDIALDLEDRTVEERGVEAWKGFIIHAFGSGTPDTQNGPPIVYDETSGLSVADLARGLEMPEDYIQSGISFWIGKRVLYERSPGIYAVLERLDMEVQFVSEPSQLDIEDAGGIMSAQAMLRQNASTLQTFIEQMLRNQGAKEIGGMMGITNVMKMVLPTFTYGDDEVKWLLEDMEAKGVVEKKGEQWAVIG